MICEIINVGTEILMGNIINTNCAFLSENLANMGIFVHFHQSCGDNEKRLSESFNLALSRSDIVILTGGLGPTTDDITKEVVAKVINKELILDEKAKELINEFFIRRKRTITQNNIKQAYVFKEGTIFYNKFGTAPGVAVNFNNKHIIILPGPPRELIPMFNNDVKLYLENLTDSRLVSKTLRVIGIGESAIEEKIIDIVSSTNPTVALYAKDFEVHIRVTLLTDKHNQDLSLLNNTIEKIQKILGSNIYGFDDVTLEKQVVNMLTIKNLKIAIAESCTGGLLASLITSVNGASKVFDCGIVSYANEIKEKIINVDKTNLNNYGAVSKEVSIDMTKGVCNLANADVGVSITGIAGPSGGTKDKPVGTVHICVNHKNDTFHEKFVFGHNKDDERDHIRLQAAKNALYMVYKVLNS